MNNTEFYDRLGVSKNASQDEIKKAYRSLVLRKSTRKFKKLMRL